MVYASKENNGDWTIYYITEVCIGKATSHGLFKHKGKFRGCNILVS